MTRSGKVSVRLNEKQKSFRDSKLNFLTHLWCRPLSFSPLDNFELFIKTIRVKCLGPPDGVHSYRWLSLSFPFLPSFIFFWVLDEIPPNPLQKLEVQTVGEEERQTKIPVTLRKQISLFLMAFDLFYGCHGVLELRLPVPAPNVIALVEKVKSTRGYSSSNDKSLLPF